MKLTNFPRWLLKDEECLTYICQDWIDNARRSDEDYKKIFESVFVVFVQKKLDDDENRAIKYLNDSEVSGEFHGFDTLDQLWKQVRDVMETPEDKQVAWVYNTKKQRFYTVEYEFVLTPVEEEPRQEINGTQAVPGVSPQVPSRVIEEAPGASGPRRVP